MKTTESPAILCVSNRATIPSIIIYFTFMLIFSGIESHGQGTLRITFDGPPTPSVISPTAQMYAESGMSFQPIPALSGFFRITAGDLFGPYNGTAYVQAGRASALEFSFTNGMHLDLLTVDLAEGSISVTPHPVTVSFVGYRSDGTIVTTNFTTDGIIDQFRGPLEDFQTFHFDSRFNNLTRVEIPNSGWSLDNLVVMSVIPEPSSLALLGCGGLLLAWRRFGMVHRDRRG